MALAGEGTEIKVVLKPISDVLPHEETLPSLVAQLKQSLVSDGLQRDPIVLDGTTGTILDGMHRLSSLKEIGARNIVCYVVNYSSPSVKLERWVRVLRRTPEALFMPLLESLKINRTVTMEEAFEMVGRRNPTLAILTSEKCFVPRNEPRDLRECFDLVRQIDRSGARLGWKQEIVDEEYLDVELASPRNLVILAPRLGKKDVVGAAQSGKLLPHKTTRHLLGLRPLAVDYPLSELQKEKASRSILSERLSNPRAIRGDPPFEHKGRTYKEKVLVLNPD